MSKQGWKKELKDYLADNPNKLSYRIPDKIRKNMTQKELNNHNDKAIKQIIKELTEVSNDEL
tara:strand:+ start:285 stop:470 length:186 start_codon:yes stop_codon:yes gene_type:complete